MTLVTIAVALTAVLVLLSAVCEGAETYYASSQGGGDGFSAKLPCLITEAVPRLQPGDIWRW